MYDVSMFDLDQKGLPVRLGHLERACGCSAYMEAGFELMFFQKKKVSNVCTIYAGNEHLCKVTNIAVVKSF